MAHVTAKLWWHLECGYNWSVEGEDTEYIPLKSLSLSLSNQVQIYQDHDAKIC